MKFSDCITPQGLALVKYSGREFVDKLGLEIVQGVVGSILKGRNVRDLTEGLTQRRVLLVSSSIITTYLNGLASFENFEEILSGLVKQNVRMRLTAEEKTYLSTPEKEINPSWKTNAGNKYQEIKDTCDKHTEETMSIIVTDVIGKTEAEARKALEGLTIKIVYENDPTKVTGVVLNQSIAKGTKAKKGDTITLTINKIETEPEEPTNTVEPPVNDTVDTPTNSIDGNSTVVN